MSQHQNPQSTTSVTCQEVSSLPLGRQIKKHLRIIALTSYTNSDKGGMRRQASLLLEKRSRPVASLIFDDLEGIRNRFSDSGDAIKSLNQQKPVMSEDY